VKDLRSAAAGGNKTANNNNANNKNPHNLSDETMKTLNHYSGMNESQLMSELMSQVAKGRGEGTLNNSDLDKFVGQAQAFLSPEQNERMKSIIEGLKK